MALLTFYCSATIFGIPLEIGKPSEVMAKLDKLQMTVDELIDQNNKLVTQLSKIKGEILRKISQLESAKGELTPEQTARVQDLRSKVQEVDDLIPDEVDPNDVVTDTEGTDGGETPPTPPTEEEKPAE